jgi:hypothetical protein
MDLAPLDPAKVVVTRNFQLGAFSVFPVLDRDELLQNIARDRALMQESGDLQALRYSVTTVEDAVRLGCYSAPVGWVVEGTEIVLFVEEKL